MYACTIDTCIHANTAFALSQPGYPVPGIGNLLLMLGGYYQWCKIHGHTPVVFTHDPDKIVGIKKEKFTFIPLERGQRAPHCVHMRFGQSFLNPSTREGMMEIIEYPTFDASLYKHIQAGFCFRFGDPQFDQDYTFMSTVAVEKMIECMQEYERVFVCSNNNEFVCDLKKRYPYILTCENDGKDTRYNPNHMVQWAVLASCPVIYHSVKTPGSGPKEITTTFAPSAALYHNAQLVGIDNNGQLYQGTSYRW